MNSKSGLGEMRESEYSALRGSEIRQLRDEVANLGKDAARYRWLRDADAGALDRPFIGYRNSHGFSQFVGEYADDAIDAAMKGRGG